MSKELIEGQEYFDGEPVSLYEMRVVGSALMDEVDAAPLSTGDQITLLLTVRLSDPKFSHIRKTGEFTRTISAKIESLVPLDNEQAKYLYDLLKVDVEGVNSFFVDVEPPEVHQSTESFSL